MKKFTFVLTSLLMLCFACCGCSLQNDSSLKYESKVKRYMQNYKPYSSDSMTVDLSEGPRTKYDDNSNSGGLNFDIKVIAPY